MKTQINYLIPLLLIFFISNIYSQTERFDKLSENRINKPLQNKHKVLTDDIRNNEIFTKGIVRTIQKQDFDSTSVVDSVIVTNENGDKEKHNYTYDSYGNMNLELIEDWDGNQWVSLEQYTYAYNSYGKMTLYLSESWDGSQWMKNYRETHTYDSNGNKTSLLTEDWDGNQWVNNYRETYVFNSNENMTSELHEQWDGSQWEDAWQYTYTYDFNRNKTSMYLNNGMEING